MKEFIIQETTTTPFIRFTTQDSTLTIKGRSTPENPVVFYEPLSQWTDCVTLERPSSLSVRLYFKYINTSSLKCILEILKRMMSSVDDNSLVFEWMYDDGDDDMRELGTDLEELLRKSFVKIPVQNEP